MVTKAFSIEDGNQSSSILTSRKTKYSDIDLLFARKISGDIFKKVDASAVKQSVKNIVRTGTLEKPFNPEFGSALGSYLFELADNDLLVPVEEAIKESITNFEPRANVIGVRVNVSPDFNSVDADVAFSIVSTEEVETLNVSLTRLR